MKHPVPRTLPSGLTLAAALAAVLWLSACASTPPPMAQLAVGSAAVEHAGSAATEAPGELAAARDKLARANMAYANKDYPLAQQLAEQAEADAVLAEAQARSIRSSKALNEVRAGIRQLRDEMARP